MAERKEGERLSILGPLGRGFELPDPPQISILIAGGVGVAPLIFLTQVLNLKETKFMMGFRTAAEIIAFNELMGDHTDTSLATDDGTRGHAGPVTDLLRGYIEVHRNNLDSLSLFTCGPLPMIKRVAAISLQNGLACQVSLETTMACGVGACIGCVVKRSQQKGRDYYHVCKDGPVFPVDIIDWK